MAGTRGAVLFDLDGTLLENDIRQFLGEYSQLLTSHMAQYVPPDQFTPAFWAATRAMAEHTDPTLTNQQAFIADFFPRVGRAMDELMPAIDEFYATRFHLLRTCTRCLPEARAVVQAVLDAGYDAVIATNPWFPETANRQRMEWADVADFPFRLVTSYEDMHFCKPGPQYFLEVAERIGRQPEECVMVGDEWDHDIEPALRAGMRAYWVNTHQAGPPGFDSYARGTLAEFGSQFRPAG